jgi:hypothetical protein
MIRKVTCFCACFVVVVAVTSVLAGVNANAKVAVHAIPHDSRTCTENFPSITQCADINYTEPAGDVDCFPVFFDLVEYQGFDYGLNWPGTYSCAFTSCSDLTIGTVVWPGDGVAQAWHTCQSSGIAVPGWGWIYEPHPSQVSIVNHPLTERIMTGDCSSPAVVDTLEWFNVYFAGIAGAAGQNPCEPTAVEQTTWSDVKIMFR